STRPAVKRAGGALLVVRREVPLAKRRGGVAVALENSRDARRALRPGRVVAGPPAGELGDRAEADRVVVAPREQRRAGGGAQGRDVEAVIAEPGRGQSGKRRGLAGPAEGRGVAESRIVDQDEKHVGSPLGRLGRPGEDGLRALERPFRDARERRIRTRKIDHGGGGRCRCLFGGGRIRGTGTQEKTAAINEASRQCRSRQGGQAPS